MLLSSAPFSICYRCRLSLFCAKPNKWPNPITLSFKRHRSKVSLKKTSRHFRRTNRSNCPSANFTEFSPYFPDLQARPRNQVSSSTWLWSRFRRQNLTVSEDAFRVSPEEAIKVFEGDVQRWSEGKGLLQRMVSFGIPGCDVEPLLDAFVHSVESGDLSTPEASEKYYLCRFAQIPSEEGRLHDHDIFYSTILFAWASDPSTTSLKNAISPDTIEHIKNLSCAAGRSYPPDDFPDARNMHRKVIMHVGPTNSGKTHNALRALAAAKTGVYAGPLRLLAHEIWERLNLGRIVPAGVEETKATTFSSFKLDTDSALDMGNMKPVLSTIGNAKYARRCNMLTGEEQKIVDNNSGLVSSTVEMLSYKQLYDVAVVDEIQMIGDPERGNGWTQAVLGLRAKELHLCGEESAIPLIQELLKETGDELIIHRYQRLSPLQVEKVSLDGNLRHIQKGDCVVTFSRTNIFLLKQKIESQTSMRCAVVYGRLPPETRSEQAALFNDPDSGYDVIIGSDAIGMGLNLKIKRIVFETLRKFDGETERFLSVSQIKQIAGRAGRYGLHGHDCSSGFTTTLMKSDMEFLRDAFNAEIPPLCYARIGPSKHSFLALANILPQDCLTRTIFDAHSYIALLPPNYRYTNAFDRDTLARFDFIDAVGEHLSIEDRYLFSLLPVPGRDYRALKITCDMLRMHGDSMKVNLMKVLQSTTVMQTLEEVETKTKTSYKTKVTVDDLSILESFHRFMVSYVWMTFRHPLVYHQYDEAVELKSRVESALDFALQSLTRDRPLRMRESMQKGIPYLTRKEAKKDLYDYKVKLVQATVV